MADLQEQSLPGRLSRYAPEVDIRLLIFESGDLEVENTVLFIGGLTDTLLPLTYITPLSSFLTTLPTPWNLAQITLSSSNYQYGLSSLDRDVKEIALAVEWLREKRGRKKVVVMGHSTGCQDAMHYLTSDHSTSRPQLNGAILQGPVSDHEFFVSILSQTSAPHWLNHATSLVESGKGAEWMPKEACKTVALDPNAPEEKDNVGSVIPHTAYRFHSLFAAGGDDDYFTSTLPPTSLRFHLSPVPLLLILGSEDEFYPPILSTFNAKQELLDKWCKGSEDKISDLSVVVEGMDHFVRGQKGWEKMFEIVGRFLGGL
jgi:pimeloyl-ACP methyl ester carboxylesterase